MKIITSVLEMQKITQRAVRSGWSIGFVPTMGALHEGHLSLVRRARSENDLVVVSIFVNPLQFGPKEDLAKYPRTLSKDSALLKKVRTDILFVPNAVEMYPRGFTTQIDVPALRRNLCGPFRPGHFEGVATVVAKLFEITRPTKAYFGEKDYQQIQVIRRMIEDLAMSVRLVACPTVREADGLAASSRNRYLSKKERDEAVKLYQTLYLGRELVEERIFTRSKPLMARLTQVLKTIPNSSIDYISVVDPETLELMDKIQRPALLALAVRVGKTRLIDNVIIT